MASNRSEVLTQWLTSRVIGPLAVALAVMVLVVSEAGFSQLNGLSQAREASVETQLAAGRLRRALRLVLLACRGDQLLARPSDHGVASPTVLTGAAARSRCGA